jgi:hypothetical protein
VLSTIQQPPKSLRILQTLQVVLPPLGHSKQSCTRCLSINTPTRRQSRHHHRGTIPGTLAVPLAVPQTPMRTGPRSLILPSAAAFKTGSLSATIVGAPDCEVNQLYLGDTLANTQLQARSLSDVWRIWKDGLVEMVRPDLRTRTRLRQQTRPSQRRRCPGLLNSPKLQLSASLHTRLPCKMIYYSHQHTMTGNDHTPLPCFLTRLIPTLMRCSWHRMGLLKAIQL